MNQWLLCFLLLGSGLQAHASSYDAGKDVDRVAHAIESGEVAEQAQTAIDSMILTGVEELRKEGRKAEATRIMKKWRVLRDRMLNRWALGDHRPLFLWLKRLYTSLESALGTRVMGYLHLTDIHILNHALPVVFNPHSRDWDRVEYRKHFVPLLGVLTYWTSYLGCRAAVDWAFLERICAPAARWARGYMMRSVGPRLSDGLYRRLGAGSF